MDAGHATGPSQRVIILVPFMAPDRTGKPFILFRMAEKMWSAVRPRIQGCPSTGHSVSQQPAQLTSRYRMVWFLPNGNHRRSSVPVRLNAITDGVPTAAAKCIGPLSAQTASLQTFKSAADSSTEK